ncbi:hypothetical protein AgCh_000724 [Apium graveolens]
MAFIQLKQATATTPVLAMPDFYKKFVVETDASEYGIGAVLMQEEHPIAYLNKSLGSKQAAMSTYEKEMFVIVTAVHKWRHYLNLSHFIIQTDHQDLKYFLTQKITSLMQQKWLMKLLGLSYDIQYKKGVDNRAVDGLSRAAVVPPAEFKAITVVGVPIWVEGLQTSVADDSEALEFLLQATKPVFRPQNCYFQQGVLMYKGRIYIGAKGSWRENVLNELHNSGQGDFIEGLPKSEGKTTILVVVDRLSKYAHFLSMSHPFTAKDVAKIYFDNVIKLHGMPQVFVSDRDKILISSFWQELFTLMGTQLAMSTAYHPQSDGQTECINRCLETYLRCAVSEWPHTWNKWLSLAEWWYNTTKHNAINMSPFEALYGYSPRLLPTPYYSRCKVTAVGEYLRQQQGVVQILKDNMVRAQHRMKQYQDQRRSERTFEEGEWKKLGHKSVPITELPELGDEGQFLIEPVAILNRRMVKKKNVAVPQVLIRWSNNPDTDAIWEDCASIHSRFPNCLPCGQGNSIVAKAQTDSGPIRR